MCDCVFVNSWGSGGSGFLVSGLEVCEFSGFQVFRVSGFRVEGFGVQGFWATGLQGLRVSGFQIAPGSAR